MKKALFFAAMAIMGLASCGSDFLVDDNPTIGKSDVISFENTLTNNSTRAVKTTFEAGDAMGIYGFQDPRQVNQTRIFNNQKVDFNGTSWSYSPLKYWNGDSYYVFYGIYPYAVEGAKTYTFDGRCFKITDFDAASGTDIMIAEENNALPFNTVTMNFNHLLSNVNFYALLSTNVAATGIDAIYVNNLEITGLKSVGSFSQIGFDANNYNVAGEWSNLNAEFDFVNNVPTEVQRGTRTAVISQVLSMPQPLQATLYVEYTIQYTDGSATTFRKSLPLESIKAAGTPVTKWDMNTIYNYTMTLDPTKTSPDNLDLGCIDWDGSTNGDAEQTPGSRFFGPDADGNYWVDVDGDGNGDYVVVWEDVDGDGKLEGGVDRDGDGHIDNVDGDNTNNADPSNPGHDEVSDGDTTNNPDGKDVILVDTDGDGKPDTQIERDPTTVVGPENPTQFTIDYDGSNNGDGPVNPNTRLVQDADGEYYVEVDTDGDGVYETRYLVLWADLDGDGRLEGYIDNVDGENLNPDNNTLVTDGNSNNPAGYDVILVDTDGDGIGDTQLEKMYNSPVTPVDEFDTVITFDAQIEDWSNAVSPEVTITK